MHCRKGLNQKGLKWQVTGFGPMCRIYPTAQLYSCWHETELSTIKHSWSNCFYRKYWAYTEASDSTPKWIHSCYKNLTMHKNMQVNGTPQNISFYIPVGRTVSLNCTATACKSHFLLFPWQWLFRRLPERLVWQGQPSPPSSTSRQHPRHHQSLKTNHRTTDKIQLTCNHIHSHSYSSLIYRTPTLAWCSFRAWSCIRLEGVRDFGRRPFR